MASMSFFFGFPAADIADCGASILAYGQDTGGGRRGSRRTEGAGRWLLPISGRRMVTYHRWMEVVIGPTLAGPPVVARPAGFGSNGLASGVQFVRLPRGDRAVLEFAQAYEQAAGIVTGVRGCFFSSVNLCYALNA